MSINFYQTKSVTTKEVFIEGIGVTGAGRGGQREENASSHYFSYIRKDFWIVS